MSLELRIIKDPCRQVFKPRTRAFGHQGGDIGRAPDSYWVLPDPKGYVSSRHCSVEFRDGAYWLRDNSRNGVFVNGSREPIGRDKLVPLQHGDRLRVAEYELLVRVMDRPELADPEPAHGLNGSPHEALGQSESATGEHAELADPGHTAMIDTRVLQETTRLPDDLAAHMAAGVSHEVAGTTHPSLDPAALPDVGVEGRARSHTRAPVEPGVDRHGAAPQSRMRAFLSGARQESAPPAGPTPIIHPTTPNLATMQQCGVLPGVEDERIARAYKILRTRVRRRMLAQQWRSLGVTGTAEGAGKTLTAINMAITFARDPRSPAILVDLDLYRPKIAGYLGIEFGKGISEYLLGEATIDEILYSVGLEGLIVVPNARPLRDGSELLAAPRMTELVKYLESIQPARTVIYDLPPLLMSDDVLVFSPHMDCVLDVVGVGVTPRASLQRSQEILSELNVVGVVLNRATEQDHSGGYYY
jgi:non-specific protein-tyrosine kinase